MKKVEHRPVYTSGKYSLACRPRVHDTVDARPGSVYPDHKNRPHHRPFLVSHKGDEFNHFFAYIWKNTQTNNDKKVWLTMVWHNSNGDGFGESSSVV